MKRYAHGGRVVTLDVELVVRAMSCAVRDAPSSEPHGVRSEMSVPDNAREFYSGKNICAPMVRISTLATRLVAAEYGADLVYSEEIVDKRFVTCKRGENKELGTIDFVDNKDVLTFRTVPEEKERLVFQVGTSSAALALQSAQLVAGDVAAIDVNMGCPKHFSTSGGMGARLLSQPELIRDILVTLRRNLPATTHVTCKIRLLESEKATAELAKMIESCGVSAFAVHGRYIPQRPREPAHWSLIKNVVDSVDCPVIANGDVMCYEDFAKIRVETGAASAMCARAAQWNLSVFRAEGFLPIHEVKRHFVRRAIEYDNPLTFTKFQLREILNHHKLQISQEGNDLLKAKTWDDVAEVYGLQDALKECRERRRRALLRDEPT